MDGYSVQLIDFENGYTCGDDMEDAVAMAMKSSASSTTTCSLTSLTEADVPIEHEGLLVALSVDVDTRRGVLTTKMAAHPST